MKRAERCRRWTRWTSSLLMLQLALALLVLVQLPGDQDAFLAVALVACWVIALLLHYANFRLTRTGFRAERYRYTLSLLNHRDIRVRLILHLLIHWLALLLTVGVAWSLEDSGQARTLAVIVVASSVLVWISFNLQHRKTNRRNNLVVSAAVATMLILLALPLI